MARGWESKAVADQIEEGKSAQHRNLQAPTTPEERMKQGRLSSLELSKARLLEQLDRAKHQAHRNLLLNGLKAIEQELEELNVR